MRDGLLGLALVVVAAAMFTAAVVVDQACVSRRDYSRTVTCATVARVVQAVAPQSR